MKRFVFTALCCTLLLLQGCQEQASYEGTWYAYDGQGKKITVDFTTQSLTATDGMGTQKQSVFQEIKPVSETEYVLVTANKKNYRLVFMDQKQTVAQVLDEAENVVYTLSRFELPN